METFWCFNSAFVRSALKSTSWAWHSGLRQGSWKTSFLLQNGCFLSSEDTAPHTFPPTPHPVIYMSWCVPGETSARVWNESSSRIGSEPWSGGHMAHSSSKINGNTRLCRVLRPGVIRVLERVPPLSFEVSPTTKVWGNLEWTGTPKIRFGRQIAYCKAFPRHT